MQKVEFIGHRYLQLQNNEIMDNNFSPVSSELLIYTSPKGQIKVEVIFQDETFWMSQKRMAQLFGVNVRTINEHLKNIFYTEELVKEATIRKFRIVQKEGVREVNREIEFYSLDAIIAVGYRVNSYQATQFRIWTTTVLKEFITKGFVLDDERLKNGKKLGQDYFDELLERIREIRASERRFYQKITDIYAQCSIDYDPKSPITKEFYATVQNKLHWAITGNTAAEIIMDRVSAEKKHMGLTNWKNSPYGKILKSDVSIAKNYLNENEITDLNLVVTMYLDYAELQAKRQNALTMKDWVSKLDIFLQFNDFDILRNAGKVSAAVAKELAENEYEKYRIIQDKIFQSDFDKQIIKILIKYDDNEADKKIT